MYFNLRKNYFEPKDKNEDTIDLPYQQKPQII